MKLLILKSGVAMYSYLKIMESLEELSKKIFQEIDVTIIACKEEKNLHRYTEDREMYETCDMVIEMIDGGFWEVFSRNVKWIDQLTKNFQHIKHLTSDFQIRND